MNAAALDRQVEVAEESRRSWREALTQGEIQDLQRMQDWRSWWTLAVNWGLVFASFALVSWRPNPITILIALFVIGARQLGFAVLMHDASHYTLFSGKKLNDWVGNWLGAYPIWGDLRPYRPYHLQHHAHTWTDKDPDVSLAMPFPITKESFRRKVWRDLSGQTGWKRARFTVKRDMGWSQGKVQRGKRAGPRKLVPVLITNAALLAILTAFGHPTLYMLWVVAWLTTYSLVMRIRAIAEHSMVPDPSNELTHTRTTLASWWERLLIAPNAVNFHLEHHLNMRVPHYHLARMHSMLDERGVLKQALVAPSYATVLREASSKHVAAGLEPSRL
jgi:fatty acid desaturase